MKRRVAEGLTGERGFTLIEVVASTTILFIVVVAIFGAISYAAQASINSRMREDALNIANQKLEQARNLPYDNVGTYYEGGAYGDPPGSIPAEESVDDFTVTTEVLWDRDDESGRALYKDVQVSVSWTEPYSNSITLSTIVYGKSDLVNVGDLLVHVLDRDTGDPIKNATVSVQPSLGPLRLLYSDAEGEAFFGQVPSGDAAIGVTVVGRIVDETGLDAVPVSADALNQIVVYVMDPGDATITVVDSLGDPVSGATVTLADSGGNERYEHTDGVGEASFDTLLMDAYSVIVEAAGFTPTETSFEITAGGQHVDVYVTLAVAASLRVVVMDLNDTPLEDAEVRVYGPDPDTSEVTGSPQNTTLAGEATFEVVVGLYDIEVTRDGYEGQTYYNVSVPAEGATIEFNLETVTHSYGWLQINNVYRSGNPRTYRRIRVWGPDGYYVRPRTDGNGNVFLEDLVPGRYTIRSGRTYKDVEVIPGEWSFVQVVHR